MVIYITAPPPPLCSIINFDLYKPNITKKQMILFYEGD